MKLRNSTDFPDNLLRRLTSWCCKEVGYPVSRVRGVQFRNRTTGPYSGHAYGTRRICVSVGPASSFPTRPDTRPGMSNEIMLDRLEVIVAVTAHELAHLLQYRDRRSVVLSAARKTEFDARWHEVRALRAFRAARETLLAEWSTPPAERPRSVVSVSDRRAAKVFADLERWQRKLKLAQTKIKKLKRRATYYERRQAATKASAANA